MTIIYRTDGLPLMQSHVRRCRLSTVPSVDLVCRNPENDSRRICTMNDILLQECKKTVLRWGDIIDCQIIRDIPPNGPNLVVG